MLSRVADSLYWMSRYLERAEHTARLVEVSLNLALDQGGESAEEHGRRLLKSLNITFEDGPPLDDAHGLARRLTFDTQNTSSIVSCISTARENARQVREQISSEMYEQLNRLYLKIRAPDIQQEWSAQPHEFYAEVKEGAHLFQGVTDGTLSHGESWQFIRVGGGLERASATCQLLRAHSASLMDEDGQGASANDYLEWVGLLKSCTSFEAYCKQYTAEIKPGRIVKFLLLGAEMPRSVRFCADRNEDALQAIAEATGKRQDSRLMRAAGKLRATLDYAALEDIMATGLEPFLADVRSQCGQIHAALFAAYIGYAADEA